MVNSNTIRARWRFPIMNPYKVPIINDNCSSRHCTFSGTVSITTETVSLWIRYWMFTKLTRLYWNSTFPPSHTFQVCYLFWCFYLLDIHAVRFCFHFLVAYAVVLYSTGRDSSSEPVRILCFFVGNRKTMKIKLKRKYSRYGNV